MVLRFLMRFLSNNEHLVQRLSESYPVRRAAQLFVSVYYRGQSAIQASHLRGKLTPEKFREVVQSIARNLKNELENTKRKKN